MTRRILFCVLVCLVVVSCKPTKDDVQPLVDARLIELGLMKAAGEPGGGVGAALTTDAAKDGGADDPVLMSQRFLAALEGLMAGFVPGVPVALDESNVLRCVTTRSLETDPALKAAGQKLETRREDGGRSPASC